MLPTVCAVDNQGGPNRCLVACTNDTDAATTVRLCQGMPCPGAPKSNDCGNGYFCANSGQFDHGGNKLLCLRAPLPPLDAKTRQACFAELQGYEIHGGETFVVRGDVTGFVHTNYPAADTGACTRPPDKGATRLLRGRLPLDSPACPDSLQTNWLGTLPPDAPAACSLSLPGDSTQYLRFENAEIGFVVRVPEVVTEADFTTIVPGTSVPDGGVPDMAVGGVDMGVGMTAITRVPNAGLGINFSVTGGNRPFNFHLSSDIQVQMPRAAVVSPDGTTIYAVDEGQQNVASGLRGQVVRFYSDTQSSDTSFRIR